MNIAIKPLILALAAGTLILTSCNKSNKTKKEVEKHIQDGSWRITKYVDSGEDETYHFNGYTFTFNSSGSISATNGTFSNNGTWSIDKDDDDNDLDFNIIFANGSNNFDELNDDWDILTNSKTKIELIDRDDDGDHDYLTFEKN